LIGYAGVSTDEQSLDLQLDALKVTGCKQIFTDKVSTRKANHPGLADAVSHLRDSDVLVIWKLDRLGRTVKGLVDFVADLQEREIQFRSLTDGIAPRPPQDVAPGRGRKPRRLDPDAVPLGARIESMNHQARGSGRILNISPGEDRCFLLRCYRNPIEGVDLVITQDSQAFLRRVACWPLHALARSAPPRRSASHKVYLPGHVA